MLHRKIFWALLLLLPIQLGKHFWPSFAFVFGIRVDYLAPTVYLTDVIVFALLAAWVVEKWMNGGIDKWTNGLKKSTHHSPIRLFIYLSIYLLIHSLFFAQSQGAAIYKSAKVFEFFLLGVYIYSNSSWILKTRMFSLPLSLVVIYSSIIAGVQFFKQGSLGGVFWFLGERMFTSGTPGIALGNLSGQEFLRSYSTFPHPNVLAGFLLVAILLLHPWRRSMERIALTVAVPAFALSFSQGTWAAALVVLCFWLVRKNKTTLAFLTGFVAGGIMLVTALPIFVPPAFSINFPEAIKMRHELALAAGQMIKNNPVFGVGLNNFISRLPEYGLSPAVSWWLQPAHNVWLLIMAETGIVGLGLFLWLVYVMWRKTEGRIWRVDGATLALFAILITGIFDHYWLTLQQTQLLATIVFGFILSQPKDLP